MNQNGHPAHFPDGEMPGGNPDGERARSPGGSRRTTNSRNGASGGPASPGARPVFRLDPWSILRPASRRWYWLLFGGVLGAIAGGMLGLSLWTTSYSATAQLVRYEPPVATDAYRPQPLLGPTLVGMIQSPEILRNLGKRMDPPLPGPELASRIQTVPERQSDIVAIHASGVDPRSAIDLANLYMREVIEFTQEHQRREANEADTYVAQHLQETQADLEPARRILSDLAPVAPTALERISPAAVADKAAEKIQAAQDELSTLLLRYTDAHPLVRQQRARIAALQTELETQKARPAATDVSLPAAGRLGPDTPASVTREQYELAFYKVRDLENLYRLLLNRQRAIQTFKANPPGNFRVMLPATVDTVAVNRPNIKVGLLAAFFGMLGVILAGAEVLRRELFDTRLKTEDDVARVTGLPVLATLGDLRQMSLAARETWAFRTWIALQDRLAYSPNHGLICGVTSSNSGDGRSTWINLLAGAARKCGFRVLTIATRPSVDAVNGTERTTVQAEAVAEEVGTNGSRRARAEVHANGHTTSAGGSTSLLTRPTERTNGSFAGDSDFTALTASALFTPAMVTEKLMGTETDPLVHIPLPGWTWNLERRKQWQGALNVWRKIDNVVILVELPPASMPESVLLASNLPNLVWLVEADKSDARDTRSQLQTLRHARCNLVGAFVNRALAPVANGRFSRWVGCLALAAGLALSSATDAQAAETPRANSPASFSVQSPQQRASWQQKLTLGPGDLLTFSLYGEPELTREEVPIGPDGRVSYLEAQNIMAAGLTVDEFRGRLNENLRKYRREPMAIVVPVAYRSKKYYVLGKVAERGAFPLDRPITLLEAVARAGGMETGLSSDRSLVELADLSRSFVARNGQRLEVDFERLFTQGDLSQNVAIEPDDYIYFPGATEKEVFVLGAVRFPGSYTYSHSSAGAIGAIAARGGFNERAWTKKIVVIRGGLTRPEAFTIDADDVVRGLRPDQKLEPRDIVFVSDRPWIYAEELLDAAANAFVTAAVVTWTGEKVTRDP